MGSVSVGAVPSPVLSVPLLDADAVRLTMTVTDEETLPLETMMEVAPVATPVTTPLPFTVAIFLSLLVKVSFWEAEEGATEPVMVLEAEDYTLTVDGSTIRNTTSEVNTALTFSPDEYGLRFTLNEGEAMPCGVTITMTGENAGYSRLYLHNTVSGKWQFLNSYKDGVAHADVAGEYLLTNQNLRFTSINWTFFIGAGILVVACLIAYVAVKKRYWFW